MLLMVSTVGTSLLTSAAQGRKNLSELLIETANFKEEDLKPEHKKELKDLGEEVRQKLRCSSVKEARRLSAELNGIFGYYGSRKPEETHIHYLISTDTFQGKLTADLVKEYLYGMGVRTVEIFTPRGLSTANTRSFSNGIKEIVKWCYEVVNGYRERGYRVVFNLVGSFKSLQGFMNTLGMFYADEVIYIFEASSADLIRIPRFPIRIEVERMLLEKAGLFAMLEKGYIASQEEAEGIPEIYLDRDENGDVTLSEWGLVVWNENKKEILGSVTLDNLEFPGLKYENSFIKDFEKIEDKRQRADIVSTLAQVSVIYKEKGLAALRDHKGLRYENYKGQYERIGHFRVNRGWRVSCEQRNGELRLRHVGPHDVNENP